MSINVCESMLGYGMVAEQCTLQCTLASLQDSLSCKVRSCSMLNVMLVFMRSQAAVLVARC
jgi:hypothetical protein